ncbi:MAG: hypothetical protein ACJ741_08200 [Pyrinomonadaceae bacterium]
MLLISVTLLFLKPRTIKFGIEETIDLLETLFVGFAFGLGAIYFSVDVRDEAFSRRMAASSLLALAVWTEFVPGDAGHYLGIDNSGVYAVLAVWALVIIINVALQVLHRLSPSNFR